MGKPGGGHAPSPREGREPGELKHLSSPRKREDSASSGERKRISPNRCQKAAGLKDLQKVSEAKPNGLGRPTEGGESPVGVVELAGGDPEYCGTREILREAGATTLQG